MNSKDLEEAKNLIDGQISRRIVHIRGNNFKEYQKVYYTTNENIQESLNIIDFKDINSVLTVLASGDQVYNLINKGINNIDTFDINKFTEYYALGLKKALIKKYNYDEYLKVLFQLINSHNSLETTTNLIRDLLPLMDKKYRNFWDNLTDYNYKIQKYNHTSFNLINMFTFGFRNIKEMKLANNYLKDKDSFDNLKKEIDKVNINFQSCDARYLGDTFKKEYDLIMLSNILEYAYNSWWYFGFDLHFIEEYLNSLKNISHNNTYIYLNYLFNYIFRNRQKDQTFLGSSIEPEELTYVTFHPIPSIYDDDSMDAIMLKRVHK